MTTDSARATRILDGLDAEQRAVATSFGQPVVVLAGAGSGKTRAITHRIAYGAFAGQLDPRHTLAVTFTTKAAAELRHRLAGLGVRGVQARTFHSAALRQISYFWPQVNGVELPPVAGGTFGLIAEAARGLPVAVQTALLRDLAAEISWTKVSNVPADRYPELAAAAGRSVTGLTSEQVAGVLGRYEQVKKRHGVIDFDDILLCAIALLHENPEIAAQIHEQYRHFTVDEYQDVSPIQRTLLELWVAERDDICVVGDLNQAIHTFAGAQPAYLARFAQDHPNAATLKLQTNYRSTPQVLDAANALIGRGLRLRPVREAGPAPLLCPSADEQDEARETVAWLVAEHARGLRWGQLAVLYRLNAQAEAVQAELDAAAVPYLVKDPDNGKKPGNKSPATEPDDVVTLSTMHSAKGLEWESVAIIGCSDGLLPFMMATTPAEVAEERRLLYVALTRARTNLRISWASGGASGRGHREPSRFLRQAKLVPAAASKYSSTARLPRKIRRSLPTCYVCHEAISEATDIKIGRHNGCPANFDEQLFAELREWRLQQANEQSMPAFVIFTDATLRALAEQRPGDRAGLIKIPGIGLTKADRYGDQLVALITNQQAGR